MKKVTIITVAALSLSVQSLHTGSALAAKQVIEPPHKGHGEIVTAYKLNNGMMIELTEQQLEKFKADSKEPKTAAVSKQASQVNTSGSSQSVIAPDAWTNHVYKEYGFAPAQPMYNETTRATEYMENYSSSPYKQVFKATVASSYTATSTLSAGSKSALTASFGGSWAYTYSTEISREVTVNPGKRVWLEWTPIKDNTWGLVTHTTYSDITGLPTSSSTEYIDVYMARKNLYNHPDGIVAVRESAL